MSTADSDLAIGRQTVRLFVDFAANPPLVKREFRTVARVHAELRFLGYQLVKREACGPEGGFMLFYTKGNVLARVKTRGADARNRTLANGSSASYRRGAPHLTVSMLTGNLQDGSLDTSYSQEEGKSTLEAASSTRPPTQEARSTTGTSTRQDLQRKTHGPMALTLTLLTSHWTTQESRIFPLDSLRSRDAGSDILSGVA